MSRGVCSDCAAVNKAVYDADYDKANYARKVAYYAIYNAINREHITARKAAWRRRRKVAA